MKFKQFAHLGEEGELYSQLAEIVERHTDETGDSAAWWAERLVSHGILNGFRVYDRSKDIENLMRLDEAFAEVQRCIGEFGITQPASDMLMMQLMHGPRQLPHEGVPLDSDEGSQAEHYADTHGSGDVRFVFDLDERFQRVRGAIRRFVEAIQASPLAKASASRINERGIALVDASRFIWKCATGKEAPTRALNPASAFGRFLADVFEACEVAGDPRSAFNAWVREQP